MIRKMLLAGAVAALPIGLITATAGTAAAGGKVTDNVGAPATASCTSTGGVISFKIPIGIVTAGGYVYPLKNKGNQIKITGVSLSCTSSAVAGTFTGSASGKIKTSDPDDFTAATDKNTEYSCLGLVGVSPNHATDPDSTLSGSLKIKWTAPAGQTFGTNKKSIVAITSTSGGVNGGGDGTFTIPGVPGTGSITGAFPGSDGGASSSSTTATALTEAALAPLCTSAAGLGSITLGSGTSSLK